MLTNTKTTILASDTQEEIPYAFFLRNMLNTPPEGGFKASEMRKRLALLDVLENTKEGEEFVFTPEQVVQMRDLANNYGWPMNHKDLIHIVDTLAVMAEAKPNTEK